jgi:type I restriction enzyme S subunit
MSDFKRIDNFSKIRRGASPRPIDDPKWFGGDIGWVRIVDVTRSKRYLRNTDQYLSNLGESKSVRVDKGDLIMSICATIGRPVIVDMPACIHDGFVQFYDIKETDIIYFYYALQHAEEDFLSYGQHGTQANLNTTIVSQHKLFHPPLPQQRKIAKILTTVDNLIEKTEALIAKYQSIKQGMMHDLFTRGIDAEGKLRPLQSVAPELYKQSELGWIPKEWEVERLGEVAAKIQDGTHFSPKSTQGSFRYVTSKNIRFGYLDLENSCWISSKEHQEIFKRCDVSYGDVLLTKDGANTGNACLNTIHEPFSLLSSVAVVRMDGVHSISEFVLHYFLSPFCQQRFRDLMSGNAITRLTLIKIKSLILPFPKLLEQKLISKRFYHLDVVIKNKEAHLTKLKSIKTALMQDLLTGKVQVSPDAEDKELAHA